MTVIGIAMVRDEADIVEHTVRHMLTQVDQVIIANNCSTDGTREILEQLDVVLVDDPDPAYYQARKMTALATRAAVAGADWVIPFDADEVWYSPHGRLADVLADLPPEVAIARAEMYDHIATADDPAESNPLFRLGWRRRDRGKLPKVACRPTLPVSIHQGNHSASYKTDVTDALVIRHFPYRSAEQFINKARNGSAAMKATDLPDHQCAHWRGYGDILAAHGPDALAEVFHKWFYAAQPAADLSLIFDPCPA